VYSFVTKPSTKTYIDIGFVTSNKNRFSTKLALGVHIGQF